MHVNTKKKTNIYIKIYWAIMIQIAMWKISAAQHRNKNIGSGANLALRYLTCLSAGVFLLNVKYFHPLVKILPSPWG